MDVRFYLTPTGSNAVIEHLRAMPKAQRRPAGRMIRALQEAEVNSPSDAPGVHVRHLRGKLWELRAAHQRIFLVPTTGREVWLLYAYDKNDQRAPKRHLKIAERRMREILGRR